MIESAKLVGINPQEYFRTAIDAHLDRLEIPLPHELAARKRGVRQIMSEIPRSLSLKHRKTVDIVFDHFDLL